MSISVTKRPDRSGMKTGPVYLFVSLFCILFGAVYERFSHGVYSCYMLYAFVFPLVGGAVPFLLLSFYNKRPPGKVSCNLYHSGIAALTVGSFFQGALEIYGTTNRLVTIYWWLGTTFVLAGIAVYILCATGQKRT